MNDTTHTPPTSQTPLSRRLLSYALRAVVAGVILGVAVWTLEGIVALFQPGEVATSTVAIGSNNAPSPLAPLVQTDVMSGAWNFMDQGWDISAELLDVAEAERLLKENDNAAATPTPSADAGRRGEALLAAIKSQAERSRVGDLWRYSLARNGCAMEVYATAEEAERFQHAVTLVPYGDDQAWLLRFVPGNSLAIDEPGIETPMPAAVPAKLLCARRDGSGEILCQLWSVDTPLVDLLNALARDGWEIDRPSGERDSSFVTIHIRRAEDSYSLVAAAFESDSALRVLVVHDVTPHIK